jgi:hypothetical protein
VGGFAVNHYGHHRSTNDIDFWIAVSDSNFDRVLAAVRQFFGGDLEGLNKKFLQDNEAVFFGGVPNKIEVFKQCSGLEFLQAYSRRLETTMDGVPVKLISLDDLKINKRASGRYKDLADLENLP